MAMLPVGRVPSRRQEHTQEGPPPVLGELHPQQPGRASEWEPVTLTLSFPVQREGHEAPARGAAEVRFLRTRLFARQEGQAGRLPEVRGPGTLGQSEMTEDVGEGWPESATGLILRRKIKISAS